MNEQKHCRYLHEGKMLGMTGAETLAPSAAVRHPWVSMTLQVWILHEAELVLSQMSSHRASVAQEMWPDLKHSPLFPALCLQEATSHRTVRDHYRAERCHLLRIHINIVIL